MNIETAYALGEARMFQDLLDMGFTPEQIQPSTRWRDRGSAWRVTYRVRLLKLAGPVLKMLENDEIGLNAAHQLARLPKAEQLRRAREFAAGDLPYKALTALGRARDGLAA